LQFVWKAFAVWRWWNEYERRVPVEKQLLKLNLDESSICVYQGDVAGNVFVSRGRHKTIAQRVPRTKRRKNLTLVATICDCPIVQTTLPQFIIGNRATFKARQIHALRSACPANVILLRSKSAWNNEETMIDIIGALRNALAPHMGRVQPVLILDAAAIHLGGELFFALISVGVVCVVYVQKLSSTLAKLLIYGLFACHLALRGGYSH
jgi:hypothetical protein